MSDNPKTDSHLPDFDLPVEYINEKLADQLTSKENDYKSQLNTKKAKGVRPSWFFVITLFIITIALGIFVYQSNTQLDNLKKQLTVLQNNTNQTDFNSSQQLIYSPVTAYGFTILPQLRPPESFESNRTQELSRFFDNRETTKSTYLYTTNGLKSGVEMEVVEYDNRYNLEEFANIVATKLGQGFSSTSETILLPDNIQLMKIRSDQTNIEYYVSVTTENYYFLTIYKQTANRSDSQEINQFTETILGSLYLN